MFKYQAASQIAEESGKTIRTEEQDVRLRLITKYTIVISIVLLVSMVVFALINMSELKKIFLREAVRDLDNLSETIVRTTHYQMLENDRDRVYQMIREVGTQKEIEHIRLINKDGTIIYSTDEKEIGTQVNKQTEACNMCHHGDNKPQIYASSMSRSRIFKDVNGNEVMGMAKGIYGEPSCYTSACHFHSPGSKILGVLDVIVSLDNMRREGITYRNNLLVLTFILLLAVSLCLTLLTQKLVNGPVHKLLEHTRKLSRGELDSAIEMDSNDEMGELAVSFNEMTSHLKKAQGEIRSWANTLESRVEERTQRLQEVQSKLVRSEKLASLGELVAGIAHEINNPLTGILMYSSMLEADDRLDPSLREDVNTILQETRRCAEIVRGLLNFARESVPQKRLDSAERVMNQTLVLVANQAAFHNIKIVKEFEGADLPAVLIDPNQIEQVFMNIVLNASQAMPEGGTLTISMYTSSNKDFLCVRISDTGCGIPEEHLGKIFDPFFSTKEQKGTGLGLSISFGIIENHGGHIEVESRAGVGTSFTIKLPLIPRAPTTVQLTDGRATKAEGSDGYEDVSSEGAGTGAV